MNSDQLDNSKMNEYNKNISKSINKIDFYHSKNVKHDDVIDFINNFYNEYKDVEIDTFLNTFNNRIVETLNVQQATLKTQIGNIIKAYEQEELVLVLGAGISKPFNIPDWNKLLESLLIHSTYNQENDKVSQLATSLYSKLFATNPLTMARYIQDVYSNPKKPMHFEDEVRKILYKEYNREAISPIMDQIVQMCISPGKLPNLDSIITYNYDDILEKSIISKSLDVPVKSIHFNGMKPENGELAIYHVHGYLPEDTKITEKNKITLGESIYHQQYLDIYSWSNIVQINKFTEKLCLIIGSSFTDPNLRRLMDIAKTQKGYDGTKHYIVKMRVPAEEIIMKINDLIFNGEKVNRSNIQLNELMSNLIEMNQKLEERDALSFGAEILWVDDYEKDIPILLDSIRRKRHITNFR